MSVLGKLWRDICVPLDGFLWHRDISHPIIRPVLRNVILATAFLLLMGCALYAIWPQFIWYSAGLACMTWIFWSWARFFLRVSPEKFTAALLRAVFLNFFFRLLILAFLLYVAMVIFKASAIAIMAGMVTGAFLGLGSYAWQLRYHA